MRLIGHVGSETGARRFADHLLVDGIESKLEFEKESGWAVWVSDEDKLERASGLLNSFLKNPDDPKYAASAKSAAELKSKKEKEEADFRKRFKQSGEIFRPLAFYAVGPVTLVLILICVAVFLL